MFWEEHEPYDAMPFLGGGVGEPLCLCSFLSFLINSYFSVLISVSGVTSN